MPRIYKNPGRRVSLRKMKWPVFPQLFQNMRNHVSPFEQNNIFYFPSLDPQPIQLPLPGAYASSSWPKKEEEKDAQKTELKISTRSHYPVD